MLKWFFLNGQKAPVPVPIETLAQASCWIEETFAKNGKIVTRMLLEGQPVLSNLDCVLKPDSHLAVWVETPKELVLEVLKAIQALSLGLERDLSHIALRWWKKDNPQGEAKELEKDVDLVLDLLVHVQGILDHDSGEMGALGGIYYMLLRYRKDLQTIVSEGDWKKATRILLTKLSPWLKNVKQVTEDLQIHTMAAIEL